jgi:hypothetical protein
MTLQSEEEFVLVNADTNENFDVRLGNAKGRIVGCIFLAAQSPRYQPWFWTIAASMPISRDNHGYAASCELAMEALKLSWRNSRPHAKVSTS